MRADATKSTLNLQEAQPCQYPDPELQSFPWEEDWVLPDLPRQDHGVVADMRAEEGFCGLSAEKSAPLPDTQC